MPFVYDKTDNLWNVACRMLTDMLEWEMDMLFMDNTKLLTENLTCFVHNTFLPTITIVLLSIRIWILPMKYGWDLNLLTLAIFSIIFCTIYDNSNICINYIKSESSTFSLPVLLNSFCNVQCLANPNFCDMRQRTMRWRALWKFMQYRSPFWRLRAKRGRKEVNSISYILVCTYYSHAALCCSFFCTEVVRR